MPSSLEKYRSWSFPLPTPAYLIQAADEWEILADDADRMAEHEAGLGWHVGVHRYNAAVYRGVAAKLRADAQEEESDE